MTPRSNNNRERGSALLVVLLMLGMIAALASVLSRSLSGAALEISAARATMQSESDLRAGIELAAATAFKLGEQMRSADAFATLADRRISVRVVNERGRVDLNVADAGLLAAVLKHVGVTDHEALELGQAVVDWRGGSASKRLGARQDDGSNSFSSFMSFNTEPMSEQRQAPKQVVGTRHFHHPAQLVSVPGFSQDLVRALLPYITVASGSGQIDPFLAPAGVLESLPGSSSDRAEQFQELRDSNISRDTAVQMLGASKGLVTSDAGPGWRVAIAVTMRNGRTVQSEAVIAIFKGDSIPYRVLYVSDAADLARSAGPSRRGTP